MSACSLDAVSVSFAEGRGLHDVRLEIPRGQVVALIGASGSGKTTLLRVLAGLQEPTRGEVEVLGDDPMASSGAARRRLRRDVGLMMQRDNLVEGLRVFHNVIMGRLGHWSTVRSLLARVWPRRAEIALAHDALQRVELGSRLWDWPTQLSGGEQQRVALARLVVQAPKLWLADEPAAGLDPRLRRELLTMLIALVREHDATLVVTLHDVELLDEHFDRIVGLRAGQVTFDSSPAEVDDARLAEIYAA
ncbi:MAG: ATP-binding cassette domain-containing protein [Myxococcota bacterium]